MMMTVFFNTRASQLFRVFDVEGTGFRFNEDDLKNVNIENLDFCNKPE